MTPDAAKVESTSMMTKNRMHALDTVAPLIIAMSLAAQPPTVLVTHVTIVMVTFG